MGGWLLREPRIRGASLRCGRPRSVRAAQAEIRKGEILGPGEEGSQISTGQVSAQKWSAAKTDPAQVERTGIYSAAALAPGRDHWSPAQLLTGLELLPAIGDVMFVRLIAPVVPELIADTVASAVE